MHSSPFRGLAAIALAAGLAAAAPAMAETASGPSVGLNCSPRAMMVEHLNSSYGEFRRGAGTHGVGGVMELYVSKSGGWTLLLTRPDGQSCPVAVGDKWRATRPSRAPRAQDAPI